MKIDVKHLIVAVLVIAAGYLGYERWPNIKANFYDYSSTSETSGGVRILTVDIARIINAQRSLISDQMGYNESNVTTTAVAGRRVETAINEVAGPDAIIIVKQAIIGSPASVKDITDDVLKRLDLPSVENTLDPLNTQYMNKGSDYSNSSMYNVYENMMEKRKKRWKEEDAQNSDSLLP